MPDTRVAAIDIGSNSIHMIVVQRQRGNRLKHVLQKSRLLKLGILEERKGNLPDYAQGSIRRTLEPLCARLVKRVLPMSLLQQLQPSEMIRNAKRLRPALAEL